MAYYSSERKVALLKMLLAPLNISMAPVSLREVVSKLFFTSGTSRLVQKGE